MDEAPVVETLDEAPVVETLDETLVVDKIVVETLENVPEVAVELVIAIHVDGVVDVDVAFKNK